MKTRPVRLARALGLVLLAHAATAAAAPPLCPLPKNGPGTFKVLETPATVCPKSMQVNDPVYAIAECSSSLWTAHCEAWPQVYVENPGDGERLQYQWRITSGGNTVLHPESSNPNISIACQPLQLVTAQVTVRNGTATDSDLIGFRCGDDPE